MAVRRVTPKPRAATVSVTVEPPAPVAGSTVRLLATFTAAGEPFDPPGVRWTSRSPASRKSGGKAMRISAGVYELLDAPREPGMWTYRIEGDGGQGVAEREVHVRPSSL